MGKKITSHTPENDVFQYVVCECVSESGETWAGTTLLVLGMLKMVPHVIVFVYSNHRKVARLMC